MAIVFFVDGGGGTEDPSNMALLVCPLDGWQVEMVAGRLTSDLMILMQEPHLSTRYS